MKICHTPVFLDYILENLLLSNDEVVFDFTLGEGGHSEAFLTAHKKVYGIDRDPNIIIKAKKRLSSHPEYKNLTIINKNYCDTAEILATQNTKIDFALFDLGISKFHYQESKLGFTFMDDEPLDMRLTPKMEKTAATIINEYSEAQLADLFYQYGEEHLARTCAKLIVKFRENTPITTTLALSNLIKEAYRIRKIRTKINPATKVFQALRIEVNQELNHIEVGILAAAKALKANGRVAVITYHSLEDRIVKKLFNEIGKRNETHNKYREIPKKKDFYQFSPKVIKPSFNEIKMNPSSRSAKMRVLGRY